MPDETVDLFSPDGSGPAQGTMDVKMLPRDPHGYGYTSGMFDGHIYLIDPAHGTGTSAFDLSTVKPHVDTPVPGGMGQIMATPQSGDRLIVGTFMAGLTANGCLVLRYAGTPPRGLAAN